MPTAKFIEGVGGTLASSWGSLILTPAFGFWLGGGLAAVQRWGWSDLVAGLRQWPEPLLLGVAIAALLGVVGSGIVIQQFDLATLRLLEGYWPRWCRPITAWFLGRQRQQLKQLDRQITAYFDHPNPSPSQQDIYIQSVTAQRRFPSQLTRLLPTQLGNILRAVEDRPRDKYGLDAVLCWPRLWLLLPDIARTELTAARQRMDGLVQLWLWSGLFCLWAIGFWVWWPLVLGLLGLGLAYRWLLQAAQVYGELVEAAFDLYRFRLYEALRLPLPTDPTTEPAQGQQLTVYLVEGASQGFPPFTQSDH